MQPAAEDHVGAPEAVVGTDQPMLDAETLAEGERPRLLGEEGVGAALDEKALVALGLDGAPDPVPGLEERQVEREAARPRDLEGAMGGGQSRHATAHHRQLHAAPRSTRSASMAMKAG